MHIDRKKTPHTENCMKFWSIRFKPFPGMSGILFYSTPALNSFIISVSTTIYSDAMFKKT